jgi:hypothetical protein
MLAKLIPFRDYAYAALAVAAIIFYNVHVHGLEVSYSAKRVDAVNAAYKKGSDEAVAAAKKQIADKDKEHANDLAQVEENYEKLIQANDAAHNADAARLRQRAADSEQRANTLLASAGSANSTASGGDQGSGGLGTVPAGLGLELADALRQDDAALTKCYADRDSLTGK